MFDYFNENDLKWRFISDSRILRESVLCYFYSKILLISFCAQILIGKQYKNK